jgi:hypothetical protein
MAATLTINLPNLSAEQAERLRVLAELPDRTADQWAEGLEIIGIDPVTAAEIADIEAGESDGDVIVL